MTPKQQLDAWNWPHRESSHFLEVGNQQWHYQRKGTGPALLLLHGTGSASQSWSGVLPLLSKDFDVIAPDLPGHGLSGMAEGDGMSLPGMAGLTDALLAALDCRPALVAGHSAGAAILARMCLDNRISPAGLISINGALLALPGLTGHFFSLSARVLAAIPVVPSWVAGFGGRPAFAERLLEGTGSRLDDAAVNRYRQLVGHPPHVAAALKMMANWDLASLEADLPQLSLPVHLVACENDLTVPPGQSTTLARRLPDATLHRIPGLGHLGHEEDPSRFDDLVSEVATELGLLSD